MPKKYTRKQLKRPDEFITASMKLWKFVGEQMPSVLAAAAAVAAVVGGIWTWTYISDRRGMAGTETLTRALEMQHQPIATAGVTLPPPEDGMPRFTSRDDKLKAAEEELNKVVKKGGRLGRDALLLRAGVRYDARRYREAIEDLQKVAAEADEPAVKLRALEDIGYCHEALREWDKALESFRKMPRTGDGKHLATYHEARILAKQGKPQQAAKLFEDVIHSASPALQDLASDQLALLEAK